MVRPKLGISALVNSFFLFYKKIKFNNTKKKNIYIYKKKLTFVVPKGNQLAQMSRTIPSRPLQSQYILYLFLKQEQRACQLVVFSILYNHIRCSHLKSTCLWVSYFFSFYIYIYIYKFNSDQCLVRVSKQHNEVQIRKKLFRSISIQNI